jgi:hypothetical protein
MDLSSGIESNNSSLSDCVTQTQNATEYNAQLVAAAQALPGDPTFLSRFESMKHLMDDFSDPNDPPI